METFHHDMNRHEGDLPSETDVWPETRNRQMRHAMSDAQKKARGIFQSRWSSQARTKWAIAKVLVEPQLNEVPLPSIPMLAGGPGESDYYKWCAWFLRRNLLTSISIGWVERFARASDRIEAKAKAGKETPTTALEARMVLLNKLADLEHASASTVPDMTRENKFANNGFPARLGRNPEDHKWEN